MPIIEELTAPSVVIVMGIYEYWKEFVIGVFIVTKVRAGFVVSQVRVVAGIVLKK